MNMTDPLHPIVRPTAKADLNFPSGTIVPVGRILPTKYIICQPESDCDLPIGDVIITPKGAKQGLTLAITCKLRCCVHGEEVALAQLRHAKQNLAGEIATDIRSFILTRSLTGGDMVQWENEVSHMVSARFHLVNSITIRARNLSVEDKVFITQTITGRPRGWNNIDVVVNIRLTLQNWVLYLEAEQPSLKEWCEKELKAELEDLFFDRDILATLEGFSAPNGQRPILETKIEEDLRIKAAKIGYKVETLTSEPDIGLREFKAGFTVTTDGRFAASDSLGNTFPLEIEVHVKFLRLTNTLDWFDGTRLSKEKATTELSEIIKDATRSVVSKCSTRQVCLALVDSVQKDLQAVLPLLQDSINTSLASRFDVTVRTGVRQNSDNDFLNFYKEVSAKGGSLTIDTEKRSPTEERGIQIFGAQTQRITASFRVSSICTDEHQFMLFFNTAFLGHKRADSVMEAIRDRLVAGAEEALTHGATLAKVRSGSITIPDLKEELFGSAVASIPNWLGLQVSLETVAVTLPDAAAQVLDGGIRDAVARLTGAREELNKLRLTLPETDPRIVNIKKVIGDFEKQATLPLLGPGSSPQPTNQ